MKMPTEQKRTRIYQIWRLMVGRCHNENWNNYFTKTYYRDKGITVCDQWRYNFLCFKEWALSNGYDDTLSIDRIDPDGNYTPDNCRWITLAENRRRSRRTGSRRRWSAPKQPNEKQPDVKAGRFMVVSGSKHVPHCLCWYKVEKTGLTKSKALEIARKLMDEDKWGSKLYLVRVSDEYKEGEFVKGDCMRLYLNSTKNAL